MPRLMLTTLPALALPVLSLRRCCNSSLTCVHVSSLALPSVWYTLIEAAGASPATIWMSSVDSPIEAVVNAGALGDPPGLGGLSRLGSLLIGLVKQPR